jgi:hypothetical protein
VYTAPPAMEQTLRMMTAEQQYTSMRLNYLLETITVQNKTMIKNVNNIFLSLKVTVSFLI